MDKILSFLSIARKAGALAVGARATESACKGRSAKLVLLARDASENTKKEMIHAARQRHILLLEAYSKEALGRITGYAETSVLCVTKEPIAQKILELFRQANLRGEFDDKV